MGSQVPNQGSHCGLLLGQSKWKSLGHVWLFATPWTIQSMGFSRPEYWSGTPFPFPGDLLNPGIGPALEGGFFTTGPPGKSPYSSLMQAQPVKTVGSVYNPPTSSPSLRSILLPRPPGTCTWLAMFGDHELQFSLDPEQTHLSWRNIWYCVCFRSTKNTQLSQPCREKLKPCLLRNENQEAENHQEVERMLILISLS